MECKDAIALIEEHIADIHADPDIYENGRCDLIYALEAFAIPAMKKEICRDVVLQNSSSNYARQFYACPTCWEYIRWRHDIHNGDYEPDRCPFCGQSLNWGLK
jgi:rubrerythrin